MEHVQHDRAALLVYGEQGHRRRDGRTCMANLSVGWFDGDEEFDHIGVELWITSNTPARTADEDLRLTFDPPEGGWPLDLILATFSLDADAASWHKESDGVTTPQ